MEPNRETHFPTRFRNLFQALCAKEGFAPPEFAASVEMAQMTPRFVDPDGDSPYKVLEAMCYRADLAEDARSDLELTSARHRFAHHLPDDAPVKLQMRDVHTSLVREIGSLEGYFETKGLLDEYAGGRHYPQAPPTAPQAPWRPRQRVVWLNDGFAQNGQIEVNAVQILKPTGATSFRTV